MTHHSRWFPGKTEAAPRKARKTEGMPALPRQSREAREALAEASPLRVDGGDLVERADWITRTPAEHQALTVPLRVARIYERVSTDDQGIGKRPLVRAPTGPSCCGSSRICNRAR